MQNLRFVYSWFGNFSIALIVILSSCSSLNRGIQKSQVYSKNHTGFYLYDPVNNEILSDVNSHQYFTPASNTKIFTFYTALNILGDSIPALKYRISGDSLFIWGTGDPSFLHPDFTDNKVFDFLRNRSEKVFISFSNFHDYEFGPGWAWDDYPYYYQPEKAPFPIYGNVIRAKNRVDTAGLVLTPEYFLKFLYPEYDLMKPGYIRRDLASNILRTGIQPDTISFERSIPFIYSEDIFVELLEDTLKMDIGIVDKPLGHDTRIIYSIPSDSLYKIMMQVSDNFFAEQLMLMCAGEISDTLNTKIAIDYSKENLLSDLPDEPIWIDGSGLSRYNLFTPRTIVALWNKIYRMIPEDRLFKLIAAGGINGTIENWYGADEPYIYGKTGSLSNNHTLSGFLKTAKGRILIFSFMHGNYTSSSSEIKNEMEKTLWEIHQKY